MKRIRATIQTTDNVKILSSKDYNYIFDYNTGMFVRTGKTQEDDPDYSPFGPELLDIEISTICHGLGKPCAFCYKSNTAHGDNMSFDTFRTIFHKMPRTLTQIAFGIGDIDANPDMFRMFRYCKNNLYNKVIPNVTINGFKLTDKIAERLANYCGAVAVSCYRPKDICYNAVKMLIDKGLHQVNIHMLLATETYDDCIELLDDCNKDNRLNRLNAIVFLHVKPKGKRNKFTPLKDKVKYKALIDKALRNHITIGFDSCGAPNFLEAVKDHKHYKSFSMMAEPCESNLFSCYINVKGISYPCSFMEGEKGYEGIDVLHCKDFFKDMWYDSKVKEWRKKLLNTNDGRCRKCPHFNIY